MQADRARATRNKAPRKNKAPQPIAGAEQATPPIRRKVYARALPLLDLSKLRVVVIDNNEFAITLIKRLLTAMRIAEIATCTDPESIGDVMQRAKPDVAIVDLDMPKKSGLEVISDIRRGRTGVPNTIGILVATAHAELEQVSSARNAGANWILVKPLSFRSLYDGLARVASDDRPFIESEAYVGPCRRIRSDPLPDPATDRRKRTTPSS
jgi:CheY-like chemotaxis protein